MGQLNRFGPRRGAGGEQHHRHVVGGVREFGDRFGGGCGGEEFLRLDARHAQTGDHVGVFGIEDDQRLGQPLDQFGQGLPPTAGSSTV